MRAAILAFALISAGHAQAATAFFTGQQQTATSVTGLMGWRCQYRYMNQTFWQFFQGYCPTSIEVQ